MNLIYLFNLCFDSNDLTLIRGLFHLLISQIIRFIRLQNTKFYRPLTFFLNYYLNCVSTLVYDVQDALGQMCNYAKSIKGRAHLLFIPILMRKMKPKR